MQILCIILFTLPCTYAHRSSASLAVLLLPACIHRNSLSSPIPAHLYIYTQARGGEGVYTREFHPNSTRILAVLRDRLLSLVTPILQGRTVLDSVAQDMTLISLSLISTRYTYLAWEEGSPQRALTIRSSLAWFSGTEHNFGMISHSLISSRYAYIHSLRRMFHTKNTNHYVCYT